MTPGGSKDVSPHWAAGAVPRQEGPHMESRRVMILRMMAERRIAVVEALDLLKALQPVPQP